MADLVKPLKFENPATGGTQTDILPTEVNPAQDTLTALSYVFNSNASRIIATDGTNTNMIFTDGNSNTAVPLTELRYQPHYYVSATGAITTTSSTYATMGTMTSTPLSGTYYVILNCRAQLSGVNATGEWSLFTATTQVTESVRQLTCSTAILGIITLSTNFIGSSITAAAQITVNGSQVITAQFRSVSGDTITVTQRDMFLLKVGN